MVEFESAITKITHFPIEEGHSARVFECSIPAGVSFSFVSGQFAMVAHPDVKLLANPSVLKWASYSISSSPAQRGVLEFCIGDGSPTGVSHKLMSLSVGDKILVKGPFGKFNLNESAPEYVFLATGTGIAPLISMIRTLVTSGKKIPISLYFGFRFPSQFMYADELALLQQSYPHFKCIPIVSRPDEKWKHKKGHIQDVLKDYSSPLKQKALVYICGKPQVAEELAAFCIESMRFPSEHVLLEKW
ncbi:MAG: FAD-dependent oxidoreductase [Candidatus Diapherotrites archaeon]